MVDIVIPLGSGSTWDNNELRYTLRSIEKHVKNYNRVWIVGEMPYWISNVIHIPCDDLYGHERNIMEKIKKACMQVGVSDNFLFMNDDHFLLKDVDAPTYPYFFKSLLSDSIAKRMKTDEYKIALQNTLSELTSNNLREFNYDIHTPILYNKRRFIETMLQFNWNKNEYVIKSLYSNSNPNILGVYMEDCKIVGRMASWYLKQKLKDRHIFSIGDKCLEPYPGEAESSVKVLLRELYPNKSQYEI